MSSLPAPTLTKQDEVTVVDFSQTTRSITESTLGAMTDQILSAGDAEPPLVVLDLTHVEFFSSSFIELMFRLWKRLKSRGGKLAICNLHPYCREVLEITNLHTLWPLADTREEAITELKSAN